VSTVQLPKLITILLLVLFVFLASWRRTFQYRHWVSFAVGLTAILLGLVPIDRVLKYVNLDVIGLLIGMSIMTVYMEECGLAEVVARALIKKVKGIRTLFFSLTMVSGIISIALENVTVVLMMAPIAIAIARRIDIDPRAFVIGIALASNMAGSATMIGDPPAIITAGYFGLSFGDFILYQGRISMFFYTLVSMFLACISLSLWVRVPKTRLRELSDEVPHVDKVFLFETLAMLSTKIVLLCLRESLGIPLTLAACVGVGGLTILRILHRDFASVREAFIKGFEWRTAMFLIGVFILSGAFAEQGLAHDLALAIYNLSCSPFVMTSLLVWLSVFVSAFLDNVPYVATMLPVVQDLGARSGIDPVVLAWAMLLGATLGGNLTYIGASANVVAVRILEREGVKVTFGDFIKLSAIFNSVSVVSGWIVFELVWNFI